MSPSSAQSDVCAWEVAESDVCAWEVAKSDVCAWEVAEAVRLGKRIIPALFRALDGVKSPRQLADLDYIFFYAEPKFPGSGFGPGLLKLASALNTDLDWLREHTRYLRLAKEWEEVGKPADRRLLSAANINLAKARAAGRPPKAPEIAPLQLDFIRKSQAEDSRRQNAESQRLRERAEIERKAKEAAEDAANLPSRGRIGDRGLARCNPRGTGVDPVWWTPLKLIFEVSDAPLPNRLSAGVPATDGRSGAIWTHARGVGA